MGITNEGKLSTELFCNQAGFIEPQNKSDPRGDAYLLLDSQEKLWVEIKKNTLNQIRPYLYLVVVAHNDKTNDWYVIPPSDIISFCLGVKKKLRKGQHTPNPLTCIGLGSISSKHFDKYKVSFDHLKESVVAAYEQGQSSLSFKNFAKEHEQKLAVDFLETEKQLINLCENKGE